MIKVEVCVVTEQHIATPERNVYAADCPTRQVLDQVAHKWTVLIIGILCEGPHRYGQIARAVEGVSPRVLSRTLRDLERDGLVRRELLNASPPAVEYTLTPLGQGLEEIISPIRDWAERHLDEIHGARERFDDEAGQQDRTPWQRQKPMP
ncbi:helix-turn-helix transcriptional regulator [Actinoallomurus purpureus]|uniref:winged helix-turn-helix transcriptional regulator n=1 Tax=Actinoallomurus purpureus TaxID=478114 RepID=UPI0020924F51|nr:helix-turn-helix domain-containing protein [Actinoallomurus purpureus]MCO6004308.1 helix-turn-helix transcriptional regulator [Actinoallomurus purpureus]